MNVSNSRKLNSYPINKAGTMYQFQSLSSRRANYSQMTQLREKFSARRAGVMFRALATAAFNSHLLQTDHKHTRNSNAVLACYGIVKAMTMLASISYDRDRSNWVILAQVI